MEMIRTRALGRRFGAISALSDLTLSVSEGEIFGLVGPDGAGKTTTMRLLTGILEPTAGSAEVAGYNVLTAAEPLKEHIGYMSQRFGLYPDLTVQENLDFYAEIYGVPAGVRYQKAQELLTFSSLLPFKKRLAGDLSGGMKQKLGLACALIHTPKVLFLDEPTNGVDPVSRRDFWRILYQLHRQHVTLFVSTAYLDEAERCTRVALLHQGTFLACGAPDEVKKLIAGQILEIRPEQPRRAAAILRQHLPQYSVNLFGDRVHVLTVEPAETTACIRAWLGTELPPEKIRAIAPTLEDVFVSVLSAQEQEKGTEAGRPLRGT